VKTILHDSPGGNFQGSGDREIDTDSQNPLIFLISTSSVIIQSKYRFHGATV